MAQTIYHCTKVIEADLSHTTTWLEVIRIKKEEEEEEEVGRCTDTVQKIRARN